MAEIKVFTPTGVKTVEMLGNVDDMPYDAVEEPIDEEVEEYPL